MRIVFALLIVGLLAACAGDGGSSIIQPSSHPGKIGGEQAAKQNNLQPIE